MIVFLYLFLLPTDILAGLAALFVRVAWGSSLAYRSGAFIVRLKPASWPMRSWYKGWAGTTFFGHFIMLAPDTDVVRAAVVLKHELEHVEQFELLGLLGLFTAIIFTCLGWWWVGLIVWTLFPVLGYLGAMLTAVLRRRSAYAGNTYERSASALEDEDEDEE